MAGSRDAMGTGPTTTENAPAAPAKGQVAEPGGFGLRSVVVDSSRPLLGALARIMSEIVMAVSLTMFCWQVV